jgi:hypothetical protein
MYDKSTIRFLAVTTAFILGALLCPRTPGVYRFAGHQQYNLINRRAAPQPQNSPMLYVLLRTDRVALLRSPVLYAAMITISRMAPGAHLRTTPGGGSASKPDAKNRTFLLNENSGHFY